MANFISLRIGDVVGSYRIVRLLGAGGMGAVYEVVHQQIGRRAALKVLSLDLKTQPSSLLQRFINEARAANQVNHQGVVQIYEFGQLEDGTPWQLMEYISGEPLS